MHELSLATGILDTVEEAARREGFSQVGLLHLEVGALACVEVEALRFALDAIAPGTCLAQAQIRIDTPPGTAWCEPCAGQVAITGYLDPCPVCGGHLIRQSGGDQLRLLDLLVRDDD